MKHDKVTIKIPRPLYNRVQQLIDDSGFNSPTDFIVYVLRDVLSERGVATPTRSHPKSWRPSRTSFADSVISTDRRIREERRSHDLTARRDAGLAGGSRARARRRCSAYARTLPVIDMNAREASDLLLIAIGAMSPLEGFMGRDAYESRARPTCACLPAMLWSLPVTLARHPTRPSRERATPFAAALRTPEGSIAGMMSVEELYRPDKTREANARARAPAD